MRTRTIDDGLGVSSARPERWRWLTPAAQRYRRSMLWRALFMVAALIVYSVAELLAKLTLLVHLIFALAMGRPSSRLLSAGDRLSVFIYELWRFLIFCQEAPPWPLDRLAQGKLSD